MQNPSPCLGKRTGSDYASHCRACARHITEPRPGRVGYVVATMRAEYRHGRTVYTCDAHIPLQHEASVADLERQMCDPGVTGVSLRNRAAKWLLAAGAVTIAVAAAVYSTGAHAAEVCPWVEPGAAPYGPHGDPVAAVMRLSIPEPHKSILADSVRDDTPAEVTRMTRDGIPGARWKNVRNMNFSGGRVCWGKVDVSMWPANRSQIVRIHASGPYAVGFWPGCGNVSELTDASYRPGFFERLRAVINPGTGAASASPAASNRTPEPAGPALAAVALIGALAIRGRTR